MNPLNIRAYVNPEEQRQIDEVQKQKEKFFCQQLDWNLKQRRTPSTFAKEALGVIGYTLLTAVCAILAIDAILYFSDGCKL